MQLEIQEDKSMGQSKNDCADIAKSGFMRCRLALVACSHLNIQTMACVREDFSMLSTSYKGTHTQMPHRTTIDLLSMISCYASHGALHMRVVCFH